MWNKTKELENFLINEFLSGKYTPNTKIPSRNQLATRHNCSRTVVERAIKSLTQQGYIKSTKGSGTVFVTAQPDVNEIKEIRTISPYDIRSHEFSPSYLFLGEDLYQQPLLWFQPQFINRDIDRLIEPNGAIVWVMPSYEHIYYLNYLKSHNVPLLLINRNYEGFDYIRTDPYSSIHEGLSWLMIEGGRDIAFVSREATSSKPYLHDRIIAFYQSCTDLGANLQSKWNFVRPFKDIPDEIAEIGRKLFGGHKKAKAIFVLEVDLVLPLITCAKNYNLQAGKDFKILTFDFIQSLAKYPGVGMMQQPYDLYKSEIKNYIEHCNAKKTTPFKISLKTNLIIE
ncbi:MAG: GntR family transcriptional regulator [Lentisphaeria bacterium]|nr:GntR family transcriptional regulator [Lentisphaeria bacterium]